MSCSIFAGILYPKYYYSFYLIGKQIPGTAQERFEKGFQYPQTFTFYIRQGANQFDSYFLTNIFINKRYNVLNLNEMSIEWDENAKILLTDKKYDLSVEDYLTNGVWYWGYVQGFYSTNFEKIFKGRPISSVCTLSFVTSKSKTLSPASSRAYA